MKKIVYGELPVGSRFTAFGKSYVKVALAIAHDEKRQGTIFMAECIVAVEEPADPG